MYRHTVPRTHPEILWMMEALRLRQVFASRLTLTALYLFPGSML
jgi:hypothetical protein